MPKRTDYGQIKLIVKEIIKEIKKNYVEKIFFGSSDISNVMKIKFISPTKKTLFLLF
jgi:hypothetical protein